MNVYDCIIIGAGGMGSAAVYQLARRGVKVLGLEQFDIAHDRGSSHGNTRIIRRSYFEHPDYVPLVRQAETLWSELEHVSGQCLLQRTGLLVVGPPRGDIVRGIREASAIHKLDITTVGREDFQRRFGGFHLPEDTEALHEAGAGFLDVERCVQCHATEAVRLGATVMTRTAVHTWRAEARGVTVRTANETFSAGSLVICAGAWSGPLLASLNLPLHVRRKVLFWHDVRNGAYDVQTGCPIFLYDTPQGIFYGFPVLDARGLKAAEHTGGDRVHDPLQVNRAAADQDHLHLRQFLCQNLPLVCPDWRDHAVCMYTMTPDEHFIIDLHPQHDNVAFACGFSGHGFKFAPAVGSVLADLITRGTTTTAVSFLSADRFMPQDA